MTPQHLQICKCLNNAHIGDVVVLHNGTEHTVSAQFEWDGYPTWPAFRVAKWDLAISPSTVKTILKRS